MPPPPPPPQGLTVAGWRAVAVDHGMVGPMFKSMEPSIWQLFVTSPKGLVGDELEHALFFARKVLRACMGGQRARARPLLRAQGGGTTGRTHARIMYYARRTRTCLYAGIHALLSGTCV